MPPDPDNPLEAFRHALAGATRAIAGDPEVEVGFTSDSPSTTGIGALTLLPVVAEYYQRVFGKDLPESVVGKA